MSRHHLLLSRALLSILVFVYCLLGFAYAVETPGWQTPDEPAHYNYIKYLSENHRFPVLQMGDYPHEYLEEIKPAHVREAHRRMEQSGNLFRAKKKPLFRKRGA